MRPSEIFERKRQFVREAVAPYRTTNPRIFGSVLHGTDREDSDIDILIDTLPGATLVDLIGLENELRDELGVPVQVLTPNELGRRFRHRVLAKVQPV